METKQGTIKSIEITEGAKSGKPWKRWTFTMEDSKKYSTFDSTIGDAGFRSGDNIEFDGESDGKYWNLKAMRKTSETINKTPVSPANAFKDNSGGNEREKSIIAQTLTKCYARIMATNPGVNAGQAQKMILDAYKYFLQEQ